MRFGVITGSEGGTIRREISRFSTHVALDGEGVLRVLSNLVVYTLVVGVVLMQVVVKDVLVHSRIGLIESMAVAIL